MCEFTLQPFITEGNNPFLTSAEGIIFKNVAEIALRSVPSHYTRSMG